MKPVELREINNKNQLFLFETLAGMLERAFINKMPSAPIPSPTNDRVDALNRVNENQAATIEKLQVEVGMLRNIRQDDAVRRSKSTDGNRKLNKKLNIAKIVIGELYLKCN